MKQEVKSIMIICDSCGEHYHDGNDHCCYIDDPNGEQIEQEALEDCWIRLGDKHYCPECFTIDDEDNIRTKDGRVWLHDTEQEIAGVKQSPLETFPRVNEFELGSSYRH